jgi:hypothetical protein
MVDAHARDGPKAEKLCGFQSNFAVKDGAVFADQQRIAKA